MAETAAAKEHRPGVAEDAAAEEHGPGVAEGAAAKEHGPGVAEDAAAKDPLRRSPALSRCAVGVALAWLVVLAAPAVSLPGGHDYSGARSFALSATEGVARLGRGDGVSARGALALAAAAANGLIVVVAWRGLSRRPRVVAWHWRTLAAVGVLAAAACGALAYTSPLSLRWGYWLWLACLVAALLTLWMPRAARSK